MPDAEAILARNVCFLITSSHTKQFLSDQRYHQILPAIKQIWVFREIIFVFFFFLDACHLDDTPRCFLLICDSGFWSFQAGP